MSNEAFYKAEAEFYRDEATRLADLLAEINDISSRADRGVIGVPPEPPVNTTYTIGSEDGSAKAVWVRRQDGWYCSADHAEHGCDFCPVHWHSVAAYWIASRATRTLPSWTRKLPS
jgi:hypothetical protein